MSAAAVLVQGFLLKANREYRKANLIGAKYKRRWVELTKNTLVYAASQQELVTGRIQVFSINEMAWVKGVADNKFQVRFPERSLTFKVETGASSERDKWVAALETARQLQADAAQQVAGATKFEQLLRNAEQQLLGDTDANSSSSAAHQASSSGVKAGTGQAAATASERQFNTPTNLRPPLLSVSASSRSETGQRPPSPRSLLASAKAGLAFVASSGPDTGSVATCSMPAGGRPRQQPHGQHEAREDDESGDSPASDASAGPVAGGLARCSIEMHKAAGRRPDSASNACSSNSPRPASSSAPEGVHGETSPPASGLKRASLTRRLTPGVMLISTSAPSTPTPSADLEQPPALAVMGSSSNGNTADDAVDGLLVLELPATSSAAAAVSSADNTAGASRQAAGPAVAHRRPNSSTPPLHTHARDAQAALDDLSDDMLTLDPADFCAAPSSSLSPSKHSSLPGSAAGSRPSSATYRPGSPLKSCLRTNSNLLAVCPMDAGAAANANRSSSQKLPSSPLSKISAGSDPQTAGSIVGSPADGSSQMWQDWDSSDGGHSPIAVRDRQRLCPHAVPQAHCDGVVVLQAELVGTAAMRSIKADSSWLNEDFDS